jgi:hypothetical protein
VDPGAKLEAETETGCGKEAAQSEEGDKLITGGGFGLALLVTVVVAVLEHPFKVPVTVYVVVPGALGVDLTLAPVVIFK